MNFITSLFSSPNGDGSSKRILAFIFTVVFIVYVFTRVKPDSPDANIVYSLLGTITLLLGIGALTKS